MQTFAWIELMRVIPAQQHANLFIVLDGQAEVNLLNIYRLEREYMVVRGRMSGTNEGARTMFLPYDRIVYLGFRSELKEQEVTALYGGTPMAMTMPSPQAATPTTLAPPEMEPAPTIPSLDPIQPMAAPEPAVSPARKSGPQPLPGKAALLERLRKSRMGQDPGRPSSST